MKNLLIQSLLFTIVALIIILPVREKEVDRNGNPVLRFWGVPLFAILDCSFFIWEYAKSFEFGLIVFAMVCLLFAEVPDLSIPPKRHMELDSFKAVAINAFARVTKINRFLKRVLDLAKSGAKVVFIAIGGCLFLSGCVPMIVSVYVPTTGPIQEASQCGWSTVTVPLFDAPGVKIAAVFQGAPDIGMAGVRVRVEQGSSVTFLSDEIEITSPELSAAIQLPVRRGYRGKFYSIGSLEGPIDVMLFPRPERSERPSEISVRLPELMVNGTNVQPVAIALKLRRSPELVGLCQ